ncbi:MAG: helix-turn-helix domain-containing protein [Gammaproteobacteria bacterium]|nr:helix-turn-helix domain-containing protein [Gammaproteobacteria bacterium]
MRLAPTHTVTEIARIAGVSRQTIYRSRTSRRCHARQLRRRGRRSVLTTTLYAFCDNGSRKHRVRHCVTHSAAFRASILCV